MAFEFIAAELARRQEDSLLRRRQLIEHADGRCLEVAGRRYLNFSSNDYLGLAHSDELKAIATRCALDWSAGSGASPLVTGHSLAHARLEDYLADLTGRDKVLLFNSGFAANQALIQSLMAKGGHILADKLSHASMLDGALATQARLQRYRHNDMQHLSELVLKVDGDTLIMTEGVFSMDGDKAPISRLCDIAASCQALCYLDDAHGFGVLGPQGIGSAEGISQHALPLLMATFGKAIGTSGAFLAIPATVHDYLVNFARHYIYSTAMSPLLAAITLESLKLVKGQAWRREKLSENIHCFRHLCQSAGVPLMASDTAIQPVLMGDAERTLTLCQIMKNNGLWLTAIRPPTVPPGSARLRITLTTAHSRDDICKLVKVLAQGLNGDK